MTVTEAIAEYQRTLDLLDLWIYGRSEDPEIRVYHVIASLSPTGTETPPPVRPALRPWER